MNTIYTEDDTFRRLARKSLKEMEALFCHYMGYLAPWREEWSVVLRKHGWTRREWQDAHRPK